MTTPRIMDSLWFTGAEELEAALALYTGLIPGSRVVERQVAPAGGMIPEGTLLCAFFDLAGRRYMAINGGPHEPHTDAHSIVLTVETQEEIDRLWTALGDGGEAKQCGWLADRFGVRWQIVPAMLAPLMQSDDAAAVARMMGVVMTSTKLEIAAIRAAFDGN